MTLYLLAVAQGAALAFSGMGVFNLIAAARRARMKRRAAEARGRMVIDQIMKGTNR